MRHVITETQRFHLFVSILDPADYQFIRERQPSGDSTFRRERVRIFRRELRAISADSAKLYRERASNLAAAGRWGAYLSLLGDTAMIFLSIRKLALAGTLFAWRVPLVIDAARNADRVLAFVTNPRFSPTLPSQTV
jgi:hypothetical protein